MDTIFIIAGPPSPRTGGEYYNEKVVDFLRHHSIPCEYISLFQYRPILLLGRIPILGHLMASIILAVILFQKRGIFIEDHYFSPYLLVTNLIQRVRRFPIITIVHLHNDFNNQSLLPIKRLNCLFERTSLMFSNQIITTSNYSKDEMIASGISPERVRVIYPGIDTERLGSQTSQVRNDHQKNILCVANFVPRKGLEYLIEGFSKTSDKHDYNLYLVGVPSDLAYFAKLKEMVEQFNLKDRVVLYDGRNADVPSLYRNASIFALPSLKESLGIVLLEAMYYSLPILAVNISAIPYLVKDGENGFLVPPKDSNAIASALLNLIHNPDLQTQMGQKGAKLIDGRFDWNKNLSDFLPIVTKQI